MPKVDKQITRTKPIKEATNAVGLSYSPKLTVSEEENPFLSHRVMIREYSWGEVSLRSIPNYLINLQSKPTPPQNRGERIQRGGLSRNGKRQLRRAAALFQNGIDSGSIQEGDRAYSSMITLTFGKHYPDHNTGKYLLTVWRKRFARYHKGKEIHFCWVAELQKRGAIHFHFLTPHFTDMDWIEKSWTEVVNKHWDKQGEPHKKQQLYPHVFAVNNCGSYMTKYLSKEERPIHGNGYYLSKATAALLKPTFQDVIELPESRSKALSQDLVDIVKDRDISYVYDAPTGVQVTWVSKANSYLIGEIKQEYFSREKREQETAPKTNAPPKEKRRKKALDSTTYSGKRIQGTCSLFGQDKHPIRERGAKRYSRLPEKAQRAHRVTRHRPQSNDH